MSEQPPRRSRPYLRVLELVLFTIGLLGVGYCVYVLAEGQAYQKYQEWAFEEMLDGRKPTLWGFVTKGIFSALEDQPSSTGESYAAYEKHTPHTPNTYGPLVGKLEIPRLKVSAMVMRGTDEKTLRRGIGWIPGTSDPGAPGNVGVAAHRDSFFRGLRNIKKSDTVVVRTEQGVYTYEVDSIQIVKPERVDVLEPTEHPTLTMVTCYPFDFIGHAPERYIVKAKQTSSSPLPHQGS